jgi:hypothetical protein
MDGNGGLGAEGVDDAPTAFTPILVETACARWLA